MDRILIVEDESIVALSLQHTLERLGYDVVGTAGTAEEALELAAAERPDLVLMDINLGDGGDGIDTAAQMLRQRNVPVIFLTAYSEDATLQRARAVAPYGYLLKPFSPRELHATVQMATERHRKDLALASGEERLRQALDVAELGIWELDIAADRLQHRGPTDPLQKQDGQAFDGSLNSILDRVAPEDRDAVTRALSHAVGGSGLLCVEFRELRADGSKPWLRVQARAYGEPGETPRLVGVVQDITRQREGDAALSQAAAVFHSANEAIFITDSAMRVVAVNEAFSALTGHRSEAAIGREIGEWLLLTDLAPDAPDLQVEMAVSGRWQGELIACRANGERFPIWLNMTRVPGQKRGEAQVVGLFSDIGALRRAEGQLLHLAHHDPLTGLPNRLLAMDRLDQAIARARRHRWRTAVLMVDLDYFKRINDTLGHSAGDELLCAVAARLKTSLRAEDTVARLGGDEFVLVLENIDGEADIARVADKLLASLSQPLLLLTDNTEIRPCASLGAAIFPNDADERDGLLRAADAAMYAAKEGGRHRLSFYGPKTTGRVLRLVKTGPSDTETTTDQAP